MIVLGIDPSLASTGLALVDSTTGLWETARIRTRPEADLAGKASRMSRISEQVLDAARVSQLVVIEGLSMGSAGNATRDLAGLWWHVVIGLGDRLGIEPLVIAPTTRAKYAAGSGRAGKREVLAAARETYPHAEIKGHDVADAVALAGLGMRIAGVPVEQVARPWHGEIAEQVVRRYEERTGNRWVL